MNDLILNHVRFSYGDQVIFDDFSHTFPAGSVCCVMGGSGRGKTTLFRLLLGFLQPDSGTIEGLPGKCAAVFQEDRLLEAFTPVTNLRFACPYVSKADAAAALDALGLGDSLSKPVSALSGGMKRRVALARCLLSDGELLILDEPFKGLDEHTRTRVVDWVKRERRGRMMLVATHDENDIAALDAQVLRL
ncbi:MAG: ATP-binding cassette domain-containing protein [Ruminococcaceae bacterium]|nr:ATP-binding cassette domain-containing protein [Oscillospiraceae bacterium]